jgi:hypothetical protein
LRTEVNEAAPIAKPGENLSGEGEGVVNLKDQQFDFCLIIKGTLKFSEKKCFP